VVKDPAYPHIKSHSRILGDHVRRRIESSKKQIQFGAKQGIPSVLLIYNNIDPVWQAFGTEPMDFTPAMYGAYTILLNEETRARIGLVQRQTTRCSRKRKIHRSAPAAIYATGVERRRSRFTKTSSPRSQFRMTSCPLALTCRASRLQGTP
jgi:hypothetical protein